MTGDLLNIYLVIFITLIAAFVASLSQLFYKKGLKNRLGGIRHAVSMFRDRWVITAVVSSFVSLGIYLFALDNAPLSFVYPTFASTFIFITLISHFYLKENVSRMRALGILVIFIGIVVVASSLGG